MDWTPGVARCCPRSLQAERCASTRQLPRRSPPAAFACAPPAAAFLPLHHSAAPLAPPPFVSQHLANEHPTDGSIYQLHSNHQQPIHHSQADEDDEHAAIMLYAAQLAQSSGSDILEESWLASSTYAAFLQPPLPPIQHLPPSPTGCSYHIDNAASGRLQQDNLLAGCMPQTSRGARLLLGVHSSAPHAAAQQQQRQHQLEALNMQHLELQVHGADRGLPSALHAQTPAPPATVAAAHGSAIDRNEPVAHSLHTTAPAHPPPPHSPSVGVDPDHSDPTLTPSKPFPAANRPTATAPTPPPPANPTRALQWQYTEAIRSAPTLAHLLHLLGASPDLLNATHLTALFTRTAHLATPSSRKGPTRHAFATLTTQLLALSRPQLVAMAPRELSTTLWAVAKLRLSPSYPWLASATAEAAKQLPHFRAPDLSLTLWALATLPHTPHHAWLTLFLHHAAAAAPTFPPREAATFLWALARLNPSLPPNWLPNFLLQTLPSLPSAPPQSLSVTLWAVARLTPSPPPTWLAPTSAAAAAALPESTPQGLSNIAFAWGKLRHSPGPLALALLVECALTLTPHLRPSDIASLVWCFARLSSLPSPPSPPPPAFVDHLLRQVHSRLAAYTPREISSLLWSLATLHYRPPLPWLQATLTHLHCSFALASPQALSSALWALSRIRVQPDAQWLHAFWDAAADHVGSMPPAAMSMLFIGAARLDVQMPAPLASAMAADMLGGRWRCQPRELCVLAWALAAMAVPPGEQVVARYFGASQRALPQHSVSQLVTAAWSAAALRQRPPPQWLPAVQRLMAAGLVGLAASELATAGWAVGFLCRGTAVAPAWLQGFVDASMAAMQGEPAPSSYDLSRFVCCLARTGRQPKAAWRRRHAVLFQQRLEAGPVPVRQVALCIWSYGKLRMRPPQALIAAAERQLLEPGAGCTLQQACMLLRAYGRLKLPLGPALVEVLREVIVSQLGAAPLSSAVYLLRGVAEVGEGRLLQPLLGRVCALVAVATQVSWEVSHIRWSRKLLLARGLIDAGSAWQLRKLINSFGERRRTRR